MDWNSPLEFVEWTGALVGAAILVFVVLSPHLLGPLLVYFTYRQKMQPTIRPFQPGVEPLPPDIDQFLSSTAWELVSEGFEMHSSVQVADMVPNAKLTFLIMVNRTSCDMALLTVIEAAGRKIMHVNIGAKTRDGRGLLVSNASVLPAYPMPDGVELLIFRDITDVRRLFHIHSGLSVLRGMVGKKQLRIDEFGGDAIQFLQADFADEAKPAHRAGLIRPDEAAGVWRATLRGAVVFAWNELFPGKQWRWKRMVRRTRKSLDKLSSAAKLALPVAAVVE